MAPDNIADYLRDADTVTIATKRASGKDHETPIWAVTVDGVPYVRSVNGSDALWYQDVIREGGAAIVERQHSLAAAIRDLKQCGFVGFGSVGGTQDV